MLLFSLLLTVVVTLLAVLSSCLDSPEMMGYSGSPKARETLSLPPRCFLSGYYHSDTNETRT